MAILLQDGTGLLLQDGTALDAQGAAAGDPLFDDVLQLLHFDGADGSTTFTNEAGTDGVQVGTAQLSTAQAKFGTSSLTIPNASSAVRLTPVNTIDYTLPFTVEGWMYRTTVGTDYIVADENQNKGWGLYIHSNGNAYLNGFNNGIVVQIIMSAVPSAANGWEYWTVTRNATGLWSVYHAAAADVNATLLGSSQEGANVAPAVTNLTLGNDPTLVAPLDGYMDDWRVTQALRYTTDFPVPTEPHPDSGPAPTNPLVIDTQPLSASVTEGVTAQFTIAVSGGTAPYTYQWYDASDDSVLTEGVDGTGTQTDTLDVVTVAGDDGNTYYVIATDSA